MQQKEWNEIQDIVTRHKNKWTGREILELMRMVGEVNTERYLYNILHYV